MSKVQLKKELATLDKEEIIRLLLDAYDARKETKEYFEFFLNPDVGKLSRKYELAISKELNRTRRGGYSKARISFIRTQLKEFFSFQPGFEAELSLLFYTVSYAMLAEMHLHFSDTLERGIASLFTFILDIADRNMVASQTMERITALLADDQAGSRYFRRFLTGQLGEILASRKLGPAN